MLTVEEYLARVVALADGSDLPASEYWLGEGFGHALAEDLVARYPVPPFDNSAMDGFAVRAEDTQEVPAQLAVVADIPAGATGGVSIGRGEAARIMTGAPIPAGADAVVPVEDTDQPLGAAPLPRTVTVTAAPRLGRHIRRAGEDVTPGATVLAAGSRWTPAAASAASSIGYGSVRLRRRPRVAILATGSELVPPGAPLERGQIPDSNSLLLHGVVEQFGGTAVLVRTVSDDAAEFAAALAQALSIADVIVTAGGVSVGAFEVVRQVVTGEVEFAKVAMQPGKPQGCGVLAAPDGRRVPLVALPGNPVSVFVSAWVFVRPLLDAMQGLASQWQPIPAVTAAGWTCPPGRRQYTPVILADGVVRPSHALGSGSHLVASLHLANALAVVPEGTASVAPGGGVVVYMLGP